MSSALRKAAILISALDDSSADRLLDQMDEQQAARVRHAVMELRDIPPAEQEAILTEFFGRPTSVHGAAPEQSVSTRSRSIRDDDDGVELQLSQHSNSAVAAEPPFHFLRNASAAALARRLFHEHPQLIALVAAHLPAEKSAQLLAQLPTALQREVIDRLSSLDDADPEILADLERELERVCSSLGPQIAGGKRHEHVQAILGHLNKRPAEKPRRDSVPRPSDKPQAVLVQPKTTLAARPIELGFEQMLSLPADDFFAVFDQADPRIVMLALAGASRRLFERYLAQFPSDRALEFERHLEQLRPLRLRDVETAQRELATIAGRQVQAAKTAAESSRRFAAAA